MSQTTIEIATKAFKVFSDIQDEFNQSVDFSKLKLQAILSQFKNLEESKIKNELKENVKDLKKILPRIKDSADGKLNDEEKKINRLLGKIIDNANKKIETWLAGRLVFVKKAMKLINYTFVAFFILIFIFLSHYTYVNSSSNIFSFANSNIFTNASSNFKSYASSFINIVVESYATIFAYFDQIFRKVPKQEIN
jgi:hypothetical protein